jgi:hypothetical protein
MVRALKAKIAGLFLTTILAATPAFAQQNPPRLFSDESEIQLLIEAPMQELVRNAARTTDPYPAAITMQGEGAQRYDMQLAARGFSRRTRGICTFPPLRLDFDQSAMRGTVWRGQNKLKLATRCRGGDQYEELIVLEYVAYRMYNAVTPQSFRVRPARVTYRDTSGRRREETQFNFLIEDVSDMARRNDRRGIEVGPAEVSSTQLDPTSAATLSMFQFMIGNLDWDMVRGPEHEEGCCHNTKLIAATAEAREMLVSVPYDFDISGFVNAPYAIPPEGLPVQSVRNRYYRGLCRYNEQAPAAAQLFRERREAILAAIEGEQRLSDGQRRSARRYIESFFEVIDDPGRFQNQVIERCRR